MNLTFSSRAWAEYLEWQGDDRRGLERVNTILKECMRDPFRGIGKPEPLGGNLSGWWSRRINQEHRLVYRVTSASDLHHVERAVKLSLEKYCSVATSLAPDIPVEWSVELTPGAEAAS